MIFNATERTRKKAHMLEAITLDAWPEHIANETVSRQN